MNNFDFTDNSNIGKEYNGFILLKIDDIPKEKCKAVFLRHKTTGLEVYHVLKDDKENLFGPSTLDESPMAYKSMEEILANIVPTAELLAHIKPIYNFKAAE